MVQSVASRAEKYPVTWEPNPPAGPRAIGPTALGLILSLAFLGFGAFLHVVPSALRSVARHSTVNPGAGPDRGGQPPVSEDRSVGGVVVTPAIANRVVRAYWPTHERALVGHDFATLNRLSSGPAREWEGPATRCGCLFVKTARPLLGTSVFVPRQTRYPATFVAEAQTQYEGRYWAELLVFTKTRPGAPWLVTQDSGFGPPPGVAPRLGAPVSGADGFDAPVPLAQHERARHAAADFASLWQRAKLMGQVPADNEFELSGQTLGRVYEVASHRQDQVQANGLLGHYSFYTSPGDALVEVMDQGNFDLACQPVRETVVYTPTPGSRIRQDLGRRNWGADLAPGYYRKLVSHDTWQTCFLVPSEPSGRIIVLNHDVGGSRVMGIR